MQAHAVTHFVQMRLEGVHVQRPEHQRIVQLRFRGTEEPRGIRQHRLGVQLPIHLRLRHRNALMIGRVVRRRVAGVPLAHGAHAVALAGELHLRQNRRKRQRRDLRRRTSPSQQTPTGPQSGRSVGAFRHAPAQTGGDRDAP